MTNEQLLAVQAAIQADPVLNAYPLTSDGAWAIADLLNLPATPAFSVWRTDLNIDEIMRNGMDWTRVDNLSVGKARIWDWMSRLGTLDMSRPNIRAGVEAVWVGTAADLAVRAMVYSHGKRNATRVEQILATGAGTTASPAVMGWEGAISYPQVERARAM